MAFPEQKKQVVTDPTPPAEPTKPVVLKDSDFAPGLDNVQVVKEHIAKFGGFPGMNPYLYSAENIEPLERRYKSGERSPDLLRRMLELKKVEPTVDVTKHQLDPL